MNIQMYMAENQWAKPMEQAAEFTGKLDDDHVQLLPKFALKYDFNKQNNIYATVSRASQRRLQYTDVLRVIAKCIKAASGCRKCCQRR